MRLGRSEALSSGVLQVACPEAISRQPTASPVASAPGARACPSAPGAHATGLAVGDLASAPDRAAWRAPLERATSLLVRRGSLSWGGHSCLPKAHGRQECPPHV